MLAHRNAISRCSRVCELSRIATLFTLVRREKVPGLWFGSYGTMEELLVLQCSWEQLDEGLYTYLRFV